MSDNDCRVRRPVKKLKATIFPMKNTIIDSRALRRGYLFLRRADRARVVLAVAALFLALLLFCVFGYLIVEDISQSGRIFPGITIAGQPVGGLSCKEAVSLVEEKVARPIDKPLVLYYGDNDFALNPGDIGLSVDVRMMAFTGYMLGRSQNVFARMFRRFLNKPLHRDVPVMLHYDGKKLKQFVAGVAARMDHGPRSARIDMSGGAPAIRPSRYGLTVKQDETVQAIGAALTGPDRRLKLVTKGTKPETTESDINKIVLIKQGEHKLYLYDMEYLVGSYAVAVGSPQFPTPNGKFYVTHKEKDPAWKNTGAAWAKDMPKYIPPGPGNPLGPYWMDLGSGVGIHATPDEASLGYSVSHGCIRMSEWSAKQVFDAVNKGTPVYIVP